ncbi:MAG: hypothetical protein J5620_04295 [Alphaproteobacteria bacterium]|nr:hypothetical protein [Alphaproteobacteria bacterium]
MKKLFFVALLSSLTIGSAYADNPDLMSLIGVSSAGSDWAVISNSGDDTMGNASTYNLSASDHNSFAVDYGNSGVIRGHGRCSTRAGTDPWSNRTYDVISSNFVDSLTDETGNSGAQYCYCGLDSYTASGGSAQSLSGPWVFNFDAEGADDCAVVCAENCVSSLMFDDPGSLAFRSAVFNAYASGASGGSSGISSVVTTQTYVDNAINAKQAKITTTGTNKLMTYGASTGATPGSRDIVSTLGTSTTATTVPETGPIVAGIANKQDAVNGTANYIMTGTGTAGTVGEKPVYSTTNNYSNALVTAQTVNTAATTAANSELTCIDNDCLLWQIRTTTPSGLSIRIDFNPDTSISGTSVCWRNLSNEGNYANYDGTCSASTLSYIGASGSKSGKWGTVFSYGDVSGITVCSSTTQNSVGTKVATDAQAAVLDSEYLAQTGTGLGDTELNTDYHCWCKMENPGTSKWIYVNTRNYGSSTRCSDMCVNDCARSVRDNDGGNFRTTMYGTIN